MEFAASSGSIVSQRALSGMAGYVHCNFGGLLAGSFANSCCLAENLSGEIIHNHHYSCRFWGGQWILSINSFTLGAPIPVTRSYPELQWNAPLLPEVTSLNAGVPMSG